MADDIKIWDSEAIRADLGSALDYYVKQYEVSTLIGTGGQPLVNKPKERDEEVKELLEGKLGEEGKGLEGKIQEVLGKSSEFTANSDTEAKRKKARAAVTEIAKEYVATLSIDGTKPESLTYEMMEIAIQRLYGRMPFIDPRKPVESLVDYIVNNTDGDFSDRSQGGLSSVVLRPLAQRLHVPTRNIGYIEGFIQNTDDHSELSTIRARLGKEISFEFNESSTGGQVLDQFGSTIQYRQMLQRDAGVKTYGKRVQEP